ncbi:hypothetical protein M3204_02030 [Mesobacillus subterraneus]|uniref:hypothetical protein n=1 Tax=Mesobacillus subterraneus TaxID=285983 RepID=UPI00203F7475|nr:hypothetical protein [Mesobacillus subterraneus]MCM3663165.1 hypothetical protein [Mesobacillus subterraneus]MCM3682660.1 hypothetical protein [Mesobacillus subterraneus]
MKSLFDFIGRTEIEKYSRLPRNGETGDSDKEALFASAGGVEVSEFLGGKTRQTSRGARRWSWTIFEVEIYTFFAIKLILSFWRKVCNPAVTYQNF